MATVCIVNPTSGGGRGRKIMAALRPALAEANLRATWRATACTGDGTTIATDVVSAPVPPAIIVVIGGDGTLSEVVQGIFSAALAAPQISDGVVVFREPTHGDVPAVLYVPAGTGSDFGRLGHCVAPVPRAVVAALHSTMRRKLDVGYVLPDSTPHTVRYFINVASVGLGSAVVQRVEQLKRTWLAWLGGTVIFLAAAAWEVLVMRPLAVRVQPMGSDAGGASPLPVDDDGAYTTSVTTMAFCNGAYFGGGMHIAPGASQTNRVLDLSIWREGLCGFACGLMSIYNGRARNWKSSSSFGGSAFRVSGVTPNVFEIDGELGCALPAFVGVAPLALDFVVQPTGYDAV